MVDRVPVRVLFDDVGRPVGMAEFGADDRFDKKYLPTIAVPARNLIYNGLFNVNQRVYTSGAATTSANQFTYDRWRVLVSGQSISLNGVVATFPAGGGGQVVPGRDVLGGTHTLSWIGTGTATVNGNAVANGGQVELTAGTNVSIVFIGQISYPKLELGLVKTAWDKRTFGEELFECSRFYQKSFPYAVRPAQNSGVFLGALGYIKNTAGGAFNGVTVVLPQRMNAAPTLTFYNPAQANANWYNRATFAQGGTSSAAYGEVGETGFTAVNQQSSDTEVGRTMAIHYALEAELTQ